MPFVKKFMDHAVMEMDLKYVRFNGFTERFFDLVLTGETTMEGPEECRLEGEDCLQMGTHTQTRYWPHKVCTVVSFSLAQSSSTPHAQI